MTCDTWHMTHDTWHMMHDMWHMMHDMWHMTWPTMSGSWPPPGGRLPPSPPPAGTAPGARGPRRTGTRPATLDTSHDTLHTCHMIHSTRVSRGGTCLARNSRISGLSLSAQRLFPMGERSSLASLLHWVANTPTLAMMRTLCSTHTMTRFLLSTVYKPLSMGWVCARKTRDGAGGMTISVWTVDSSGGSAGVRLCAMCEQV